MCYPNTTLPLGLVPWGSSGILRRGTQNCVAPPKIKLIPLPLIGTSVARAVHFQNLNLKSNTNTFIIIINAVTRTRNIVSRFRKPAAHTHQYEHRTKPECSIYSRKTKLHPHRESRGHVSFPFQTLQPCLPDPPCSCTSPTPPSNSAVPRRVIQESPHL